MTPDLTDRYDKELACNAERAEEIARLRAALRELHDVVTDQNRFGASWSPQIFSRPLLTPEDLTKIRRSNRKRPKTPRPYWKAAQPITPGRKGIRIERIIDELEEGRR